MVKWLNGNGTVVVRGYGISARLTADQWVAATRRAVQDFENAVGKPPTEGSERALRWLKACGVCSKEHFFALKEHLALLEQPGDPSRVIRCRRCNAVLTDPVSKAIGLGPACRAKEGR